MSSDWRRATTGLLLLAACVASGWALYALTTAAPPFSPAELADQGPDYSIKDFRATVMGADGEREYTLAAPLLRHYRQQQLAELTAPHLIQFQNGQPLVEARADHGWLDDAQKQVLLSGNVRVRRGAGASGRASLMTTTEMRIFLK